MVNKLLPMISSEFLEKQVLLSNLKLIPILLGTILIIGAGLRFYDLEGKSFWGDELLSMESSQHIVDIKTFLSKNRINAHPPLYFLLLRIWSFFGKGEFHLRTLSAIMGILVIPSTYLLGRQFFKPGASLLGAYFVAISPFLLRFDQEVRMYPLFVFLSTISIFFCLKALKEDKNKYWFGYIIFTILNTYTHYHAFLVVAAMWIFFFLRFRTYGYLWKKALLSQIIIAFLFCFWLPSFLFHLDLWGMGKEPTKFPSVFGLWIKPLYLFFAYSLGQTVMPWNLVIIIPGTSIFSLLFFWGLKTMNPSRETLIFFLIMLCLPVALTFFISDPMPRYLAFLCPVYLLTIGKSISELPRAAWQIITVLLITFLSGYSLHNYYLGREFHIMANIDPWREAGNYLKENVKQNDIIFNIGGGAPVSYYSGLDTPMIGSEVTAKLKQIKGVEAENIWILVASPSYKKYGEEALSWMDKHYKKISEKRYLRDPDYARKSKFFKKKFLEYRIKIYQYKKNNSV